MTLLLNPMMVHGIRVGGMLKNTNTNINSRIVRIFFSISNLYGL
jgi:hypothetical protein